MTIGERIRQLRIEKELTQTQLSDIFHIAKSTLSQYENNIRTPNDDIKIKLANYFNVSVDYLLGKTNVRNYESKENTVALHTDDYDELPQEAKDEINNFIEYVKQKYKK